MIKQVLTGFCLLMLLFAVHLPAQAQTQPTKPIPAPTSQLTSIAKPDLDKFTNAIKQMLKINQASESQIEQVLKAEGFSDQRFNEIYKAQKDPKTQPAKPITAEEKQSYDRAVAKIIKIQQDNESKMETAIAEQGLDVKRFNEIFDSVQKNPELQQEVKKKVQS